MPTSPITPTLSNTSIPRHPRALVLVLHGGTQNSVAAVDRASLAWQRGRLLARALSRHLASQDVGVALLRYRVKGWNDDGGSDPAPVRDARWALRAVSGDDVPIVLVGHSMGARTAVAVADHPDVVGVVALAGWLPADEPTTALTGKVLRAGHGRRDKITSFRASSTFVERAGEVADAEFTDMGQVGHYLVRDASRWNEFAARSVQDILVRHSHYVQG